MTYLNSLERHPGIPKKRKRVGRGVGSGLGKTSGRGHKGQKQRGPGPRPGFEGGQMPIMRIMPKRGFSAAAKVKFQIVNTSDLNRIEGQSTIDAAFLIQAGFIKSKRIPVKVLGNGELTKSFTVKLNCATKSAIEKIQNAGGKFEAVGQA